MTKVQNREGRLGMEEIVERAGTYSQPLTCARVVVKPGGELCLPVIKHLPWAWHSADRFSGIILSNPPTAFCAKHTYCPQAQLAKQRFRMFKQLA